MIFFGLRVIKILEKLNKKIPKDIKFIGYDGVKMSYEQDFIMSTIRQPVEQMAKEAVEMLFKMIEGDYTSKKVKLPVYYIKGDTHNSIKKFPSLIAPTTSSVA